MGEKVAMAKFLVLCVFLVSCAGEYGLHENNDFFSGWLRPSDSNYTQGLRVDNTVKYQEAPEIEKFVGRNIPQFPFGTHARTPDEITFALGQDFYTPNDKGTELPLPSQEPYAGWLYGKAGRLNRSQEYEVSTNIYAGIIGPGALGKEIQNGFHKIINDAPANGWRNQLHNEPGLYIEHIRRFLDVLKTYPSGLGYAFFTDSTYQLGNIHTELMLSKELQFGYNLQPLKLNKDFTVYVFLIPSAHIVARNIFFDGNTWEKSQSVSTRNAVADVALGIGFEYMHWIISYTLDVSTRDYSEQPNKFHMYGQLLIEKKLGGF